MSQDFVCREIGDHLHVLQLVESFAVLLNNALERRTHNVLSALDLEVCNEGPLDDFVTGCLGDEGIVLQRLCEFDGQAHRQSCGVDLGVVHGLDHATMMSWCSVRYPPALAQ